MATILVVDDAAFMRMRMSKILSEAGYEVLQAENGLEAVEKYRASRPDAVLMDITMPEMDGLTALKEIRSIDPAARVAMVTALGQQQIVLEAVKSGAKDFLVKPCEGDRVLAAVSKLCA
jgi:two-component system chemotaxis response regulator CheY